MRESVIEGTSCRYAESTGWYQRKYVTPAKRAAPDRIFIKSGQVLFIEFKATGKKATKAQLLEHKKIRNQGIPVFVCDDISDAKMILDIYEPLH